MSFRYYMCTWKRPSWAMTWHETCMVGNRYLKGIAPGEGGSGGVEQSKLKAREWWVKAAEKGHENAMACVFKYWMLRSKN